MSPRCGVGPLSLRHLATHQTLTEGYCHPSDMTHAMQAVCASGRAREHRGCTMQGSAGFGRLWAMNHTEWPFGLMGCVGSFGLGFMMPGMAYCMSSIIAVFYNPDTSQIPVEARTAAAHLAIFSHTFLPSLAEPRRHARMQNLPGWCLAMQPLFGPAACT